MKPTSLHLLVHVCVTFLNFTCEVPLCSRLKGQFSKTSSFFFFFYFTSAIYIYILATQIVWVLCPSVGFLPRCQELLLELLSSEEI